MDERRICKGWVKRKEGRREGGKEGRREGGKEGRGSGF
jgi:hypothetical protein